MRATCDLKGWLARVAVRNTATTGPAAAFLPHSPSSSLSASSDELGVVVLVVAVAAEEGVVLEVARPLVGRDAHEVVPAVALVAADPRLARSRLVPRLQADLTYRACGGRRQGKSGYSTLGASG